MVLTRRIQELPSTLAFVAEVAQSVGQEPDAEELGTLRRFTFPLLDRS